MLALLAYPLGMGLLLGTLALLLILLGRRGAAASVLFLALAGLYLCATAPVADALMNTLERDYPSKAMSATASADAIVLLGGGVRGDTHMGTLPDLNRQADRLLHAVALFKAGKAPLILVTGGGPAGARPEAQMTQDLLEVMGVPRSATVLETRSRNTHDNAVYSASMLQGRGLHRILLVTSAFHMRRSRALFEAQGLEVLPAPTDFQQGVAARELPRWLPDVGNLARSTHAIHEHLGYWVYRWRGWL